MKSARFFALGLLLLYAALFEIGQDGSDLKLLAEWVVREETRISKNPINSFVSEDWLLGLTSFKSKHELWRRLTHKVLRDSTKGFPRPEVSAILRYMR